MGLQKAKVGLKRGKLLGNALASGPFENSSAGAGRPLGNTLAAGKAPAGLERSAADRWEGEGGGVGEFKKQLFTGL